MSGILSQEEIDSLINNSGKSKVNMISEDEIDTLGEVGNISMGTAATTLYEILGKRVDITTPRVSVTTMKKMSETYTIPYVGIEVRYTKGLEGYNILVLKKVDALIISDLLMGGVGSSKGELDNIKFSALAEVMNQMIGSSSTSISSMIGKEVNIAPPRIFEVNFESGEVASIDENDDIIKISFKMVVEGVINSEIMQIMPYDYAKSFVKSLLEDNSGTSDNAQKNPTKKIGVKPLTLKTFSNTNDKLPESQENIDILMDIPLPITIELGRNKKTIKDILDLSEGSIVVLDKSAGDLVDVVVNGKLIAKGEVVIVDENYGVRITDIISSTDTDKKGKE